VGHVARLIEAAGIPTVIIAVQAFRERLAAMKPPRVLLTPHLMGQPLGPPHQVTTHKAVVKAALNLLRSASTGNTMVDFDQ